MDWLAEHGIWVPGLMVPGQVIADRTSRLDTGVIYEVFVAWTELSTVVDWRF